jgi:orotate phosphoribosyltransferase-like protein
MQAAAAGISAATWFAIAAALALAVQATVEMLDRLGLPTPLQKKREQRNRALIEQTLDALGLRDKRRPFAQLLDFLNCRTDHKAFRPADLDPFVVKYSRMGPATVGTSQVSNIECPIDFMDAISSEGDLAELARILTCNIVAFIGHAQNDVVITGIVAPLQGNPALGVLVAAKMGYPLALIHPPGGPIAADTVLGTIKEGGDYIVIHDVLSTGDIIARCAEVVRSRGAKVQHVFVLVERIDGQADGRITPTTYLSARNLFVHAVRTLDSHTILEMRRPRIPAASA